MNEHQTIESSICKNCGSNASGNFCNNCGQKILVHKESFGELLHEFFSDFTHFDSKLIKCIIPLLFKPARLTKLYIDGKRKSQFHPIRLYLFTSFIYFFLVFSGGEKHENKSKSQNVSPVDSIFSSNKKVENDSIASSDSVPMVIIGSPKKSFLNVKTDKDVNINLSASSWLDSLIENDVTVIQYDSTQNNLAAAKRDGFIKKYFVHKLLLLAEESRKDNSGLKSKINSAVTHNFPKMLFFLLPIFAFLLKLLYVRRREFFYFDHAVFSLHFFSFIFILLSIVEIPDRFSQVDIISISVLYIFIYLFFAMKYLYNQSYYKTFLKYLLLLVMFLITAIFVFIITFVISAALAV